MTTEDADRVVLRVRDKAFFGWTSVEIRESLEEVATSAAVAVVGVYATGAGFVREDDDIELRVGDEVVMTGVIDDLDLGGDAETQTAHLAGRSRTREAVDCSAPAGSWSAPLLKVAQELVRDYGLDVVDECGVGGRMVRHRTELGEKVFDALDRLARDNECMVTDDAQGRVVLTQAGRGGTGARIERGRAGFLKGNARRSCAERYSEVICQGQSIGDAEVEVAAQGAAIDVGVRRTRRLIIRPERGVSKAAAARRARWEVATRAAKALEYTCTMRGWRDSEGRRWRKNTLVTVRDPFAGVWDAVLLVVDVSLKLTAQEGRTAELRLVPPEAYAAEPKARLEVSQYDYVPPESTAPEREE
jgi:prophage tail gpP-like protein